MRQYTWDEYYEKFYDWAESTQVRNLSALTSLGTADEVGEIIIELQVNVPAANRLLRKAVEAKLAFSASDLIEFLCINDKTLATAALHNSVGRLTSSDMEDLYGVAEDDDIIKICRDRNLTLPEDLREEEYEDEEEEEIEEEPCANCPPHYGYRYGRWYYGHDHVHGCEFGGNKGSGSRD